jgi:hypothetical protein
MPCKPHARPAGVSRPRGKDRPAQQLNFSRRKRSIFEEKFNLPKMVNERTRCHKCHGCHASASLLFAEACLRRFFAVVVAPPSPLGGVFAVAVAVSSPFTPSVLALRRSIRVFAVATAVSSGPSNGPEEKAKT